MIGFGRRGEADGAAVPDVGRAASLLESGLTRVGGRSGTIMSIMLPG